jgi:hypothetical protein
MGNEPILDERGVCVTTTRADLMGVTYPVNGVTSVRVTAVSPSLFPLVFLSSAGCIVGPAVGFALSLVLGQPSVDGEPSTLASVVGGLVMFALVSAGIVVTLRGKTTYVVVIGTAGGDRSALRTRDAEFARRVVEALNTAIERRG